MNLGIESNMTWESGRGGVRLGSGLVDLVESLVPWPGNNEASLKNFCQDMMGPNLHFERITWALVWSKVYGDTVPQSGHS